MTIVTREQILIEARSWIGTPYHHQGRLKGVGVDCAGVMFGVGHRLGILIGDTNNYGKIPLGNKMKGILLEFIDEISVEEAQPGDIGVFTFSKYAQHIGILTDGGVIHSYEAAGKCVEHQLNNNFAMKLIAAYQFRGVS